MWMTRVTEEFPFGVRAVRVRIQQFQKELFGQVWCRNVNHGWEGEQEAQSETLEFIDRMYFWSLKVCITSKGDGQIGRKKVHQGPLVEDINTNCGSRRPHASLLQFWPDIRLNISVYSLWFYAVPPINSIGSYHRWDILNEYLVWTSPDVLLYITYIIYYL